MLWMMMVMMAMMMMREGVVESAFLRRALGS
jgi:hypothetical protein